MKNNMMLRYSLYLVLSHQFVKMQEAILEKNDRTHYQQELY